MVAAPRINIRGDYEQVSKGKRRRYREKERQRKLLEKQELLLAKNYYGITDMTPYNAVRIMEEPDSAIQYDRQVLR